MDTQRIMDTVKKALAAIRKISADKVLWIWALAMILGLLFFKLINKDLPGMSASLVFGSWWEDELEDKTLTNLIAEFESQNPGITVQLEKMSWDEIQTSLAETTAGNGKKRGAIDIFSVDPYAVYDLENHSYLADLENNAESAGNAAPVVSFINPLFYNIDLLKAAGFDRPPKNQTEFLSYVQRLKETGVNGAGLALDDPRSVSRQFLSWIWAAAGTPVSAGVSPGNQVSPGNPGSFNFNSKEVIETLNFLNQLKQNLYSNPFDLSETELLESFQKGQVGMMIGSTAVIQKLKTMNINFGITTIPAPESYSKKPVFPLTVWYAGINRQSVHQEAARKFIAFLEEKAETIAAAAYAIPGSGSRSRELSRDDPYYAKAFDMFEAGEVVRELYLSPNLSGLNNMIQREAELLFRGVKTSAQCAEALQQGWTELAGQSPPGT